MQVQQNLEQRPQRKKKRALKIILACIAVLIILTVFLVPAFVSSEKCKKIILAKINKSIDGKTDFADLSMGWWKGIKVSDVSFNDSSGQTSIEVKQIATKPHYSSILFGNVSLGKTVIDEPRVKINLKARQPKKNRYARQETPAGRKPEAIALPLKNVELVINDGNLKVTDPKAGTVEIARINSKLNLHPPGERSDFDMTMVVAQQGRSSKISAEGKIEPSSKKGWTFKGTSGDLTVKVDNLDLGSLEPLLAWAGTELDAEGKVSADIKSEIKDGKLENLDGTIKAKNLDLMSPSLKGDTLKTSLLDVDIELSRDKELINIDKLQIQADWLTADATGVVPTTFESLADFVKADSKSDLQGNFDCDLAALLSQMPHTLGLKEGMKITSGKLSGSAAATTKRGKRKVTGNASLEGLKGTVDGKTIALQQPVTAEADITAEKDKVIFDKIDVTASFGSFDCSGTSESLKYTCDVDLSAFQTQLGQFFKLGEYKLAGQATESGTISTKKDYITAVGSSTIKNLVITSKDGVSASEPQADINFDVGYDRKNHAVTIDSIKTTASLGQVDIKDAVLPIGEKAKKSLELSVSANVDLQKARPFAVMFASFPKEMQLAGIAESELSISSKNNNYRIITDATKIKNFKYASKQQKPFERKEVSLVADVEFNPVEKTYGAKKFDLLTEQIKVSFTSFNHTTEKGQAKLQGQAELEYDWSAVGDLASSFLPEELKMQGKRKDTITFTSEYPTGQKGKLLENLNTKAKVGFTKAQYMGLNFGPTDVDIQIQKGLLKIAPFSTTVNNGQLTFAAEADFKEKPTLLKTSQPIEMKNVQVNEVMSRKLLVYVNPIFLSAVDVTGVANFSAERLAIPLDSASKNKLEVAGTIDIDKLQLRPVGLLGLLLSLNGQQDSTVDMKIHPTRFALKNGLLKYEDMQLDIGDNPVNFKGTIGLDKSVNMAVTLPYTMGGRTARVGEEARDRISLPLTGSIDKPELDTAKLFEQQLKQRLGEELQKGLEKLFE